MPPPKRPYTEAEDELIWELRHKGVTPSEIGRRINRPRQSVSKQLRDMALKKNPPDALLERLRAVHAA